MRVSVGPGSLETSPREPRALRRELDTDIGEPVGAEHRDSPGRERCQSLGSRVTEAVLAAARKDRQAGMDRVQEARGGRRAASVMRDFEEVGAKIPPASEERVLGRGSSVAGQKSFPSVPE